MTGWRRIPALPPACREMIMLTLKVLACLALSSLMLVPVVLQRSNPSLAQVMQTPNVDAHAMWSQWPQR
ncbi:hypothetical protein ASR47_101142 [Janthinobacterium psychrotolerans]|uniref:Uncharacterized protein n=2 Tax=Janthinobacterium psychrotolerans TaxID=1747903 RepID=A0A1A7C5S8_9BURK|nr:hypothetical protein ASR47_101142 [Janthinobacterium psychrotolerans]